jgi:hypothetical protein
LKRLPILLIGHVFNGDGVVTLADFAAFFGLAFALLQNIYKSGRRNWLREELWNVILQQIAWVSMSTTIQSVLEDRAQLLTSFGERAAEYSRTGQGVYGGISLKILPSLSIMSSLSISLLGILDVSSLSVY